MGRARAARVAVLGNGGWGTTLAIHLHGLGHRVCLWGAFLEEIRQLNRRRENVKFLPGIRIPRALRMTADLADAAVSAHILLVAIPSQYLRGVLRRFPAIPLKDKICVSVAKGLEHGSGKRMSEIIQEELGRVRLAVLSGPNIASEIARHQPASSVVASTDAGLAIDIQQRFMNDRFRLYTSTDVKGVELGGALKNPIAIAAGIGDGLGFGANAKAALITRGVVEMARLGAAMGARPETLWGLSGLGDLITTAFCGRNHWVGQQLGQGRSLQQILGSTPMVIEGVETAKAAVVLGRRYRVELPIIEQVAAIVSHRRSPRQALQALMSRASKPE